MEIGIIGYGTIGKCVSDAFREKCRLHVYDPAKPKNSDEFEDSVEAVWERSQFVFICVPTPQRVRPGEYGGPFDGSAVDCCMESLGSQAGNPAKRVILTSTTLPSRVAKYQEEWPHLCLVVCPEFGRQETARDDYLNPRFRILGGDENDAKAVQDLFTGFSACSPCPVGFCDAVGAALIKYMNNAFLATKVSVLNQFHELWQKSGCATDWMKLMEAWHLDERLGNSHYQVPGPDGDRGWGGKCYPKDVNALLREAEDMEVELSILKQMWNYNLSIRKNIDWVDN